MADIKRIPHKLVHLQTKDNHEYVLIQWRTKGFESEKYYSLHLCSLDTTLISPDPVVEFTLPFEQRHRYAPYFHGFLPLLVYAISAGMFRGKKKVRLSLQKLDIIFDKFLDDYNDGTFDSYVISAPEVGKVIRGRIKDE